MKGNPPLKFAGPCTQFIPTRSICTTKSIPCPVWISKEALSAFPPSIVSKQMENRFGIPRGNITSSLNGRTTPDIIVWEYAPDPDSKQATQRGLLRPRRFFGPARTRSDEAECHSRVFHSLAPSHLRNSMVPDVLNELSGLDNPSLPNFLSRQQHMSLRRRHAFHRQSFLHKDPNQVTSNYSNGATPSICPGLLLRQNRPASSSERELRRGMVSSRAPYDLAQRLHRAICALQPHKCGGAPLGEETPDDPLIHSGGEKNRRTPRTIRRRFGRAVRTLESQANTNQSDSPFSSREKHPFKCGGDATSKFNSIPPMNPRTSRKSYCEICNERDAGSTRNTQIAPPFHDPIKMIHSIDLFGGDLKLFGTPMRKTRNKALQTPDFLQRDHLRLFLRRKRWQERQKMPENEEIEKLQERQHTPPTLLANQLGKSSRNKQAPHPPAGPLVPPKGRDRAGRGKAEDLPESPSPVRTFKPPARGFAPVKAPVRRKRAPLLFHKAVQVGLPLPADSRCIGGRDLQRRVQRKKTTSKASRSPKRALRTNAPSGANDPETRNPQPLRKQKARTRSPKGKSRKEEPQALNNEPQNETGLNTENYYQISISMQSLFASSGNEQELETSASTSSARSIFSIQKLQDMVSSQNYRQFYDNRKGEELHQAERLGYTLKQNSHPMSPMYRILQE